MYRKILALVLVALMFCFVGCKKEKVIGEKPLDVQSVPAESTPEVKVEYFVNPLTGVKDLTADKTQNRPVAIMVNNASEGKIHNAQLVQTGLSKADIVYETEVEGGVTRLMAVFKDISKVEKIGTVRSARYAYIDLAMGHDAIYIHHGLDKTYAGPHLKDTQTFSLDEGEKNAGVRDRNNGMAIEHTLYGLGDKIWKCLQDRGYNTKLTKSTTWQAFAEEDTSVKFENAANTVNVPFSTRYKSVFKYDEKSGKYIRFFNTTERKDYYTGESEYFKNVFVLTTSITDYPDGYHRKVDLTSGSGYYCVNGTYTPIKWSKGSSSSSFVFTNEDGTPLTVNQGNSWVCIMGKKSVPSFE